MAFFALAGFAFLMTQYFQLVKGYSPIGTGVRLLPVALSVGFGSFLGVKLALSVGHKAVIATGLFMVALGYVWISKAAVDTSYLEIAGQMVVVGLGMGFSTAPATEAIMGAVPAEKAGIGSAVNDATRELGATLGVATLGSVFSSLYQRALEGGAVASSVPAPALHSARESFSAALQVAGSLGGPTGAQLANAAKQWEARHHAAGLLWRGDAMEEAVQFLEREALVGLPEQEILGLPRSLQGGLKLLEEQLLQGQQLAGE
jgi:hypothetical protein